MALISEWMEQCGKKVLDDAGIVRDAMFQIQIPRKSSRSFVRAVRMGGRPRQHPRHSPRIFLELPELRGIGGEEII
jgi:hypothetical protein